MQYVETDCTVRIEGRTFESGGAYVNPERAVVYIASTTSGHLPPWGTLTDWHGNKLGTYERVSAWITPGSWVSSMSYAIRATIDGRLYHGRTQGPGMVAMLKACKHQ